jgi:hypothetical protein
VQVRLGVAHLVGRPGAFPAGQHALADDVVRVMLDALDGAPLAGTLAVGSGSAAPCADIVAAATGSRRIAMTSPPVPLDGLRSGDARPAAVADAGPARRVDCHAAGAVP